MDPKDNHKKQHQITIFANFKDKRTRHILRNCAYNGTFGNNIQEGNHMILTIKEF